MTTKEMQQRYQELFGKPTKSRNSQWLKGAITRGENAQRAADEKIVEERNKDEADALANMALEAARRKMTNHPDNVDPAVRDAEERARQDAKDAIVAKLLADAESMKKDQPETAALIEEEMARANAPKHATTLHCHECGTMVDEKGCKRHPDASIDEIKSRVVLPDAIDEKIAEGFTPAEAQKIVANAKLIAAAPAMLDALPAKTREKLLARDGRLPPVGSVLTRKVKDVVHNVKVLAAGFEYAGKEYRSLSAIAREITGTIWNGMLFFGLTKRGKAA
jgi:hypothetical protein